MPLVRPLIYLLSGLGPPGIVLFVSGATCFPSSLGFSWYSLKIYETFGGSKLLYTQTTIPKSSSVLHNFLSSATLDNICNINSIPIYITKMTLNCHASPPNIRVPRFREEQIPSLHSPYGQRTHSFRPRALSSGLSKLKWLLKNENENEPRKLVTSFLKANACQPNVEPGAKS